ncbi:MAG: DUF4426 domain-containing protein [Chromatiales bacterium]|nr:DUF4426 domain-containing protein [Chromatiales bacterium]
MRADKTLVHAVLVLFALAVPQWAAAENSKDVGEYVIHYNAFPSDVLSPQISRQYGLARSKERGILNITVLRKVMGTASQPVSAWVKATATNLSGQLRSIPMREIRERNAIYYIAQMRVADQETLRFNVRVQPIGTKETYTVEFSQQFHTR